MTGKAKDFDLWSWLINDLATVPCYFAGMFQISLDCEEQVSVPPQGEVGKVCSACKATLR